MALFRHGTLSEEEKIYIVECHSGPMEGFAFGAQLCKFPTEILFEIDEAIREVSNGVPKTSFNVGDMVSVIQFEAYCRAEVLEVCDSDCLLDLVDAGAVRKFPKKEIFPLSPELCRRWERVAIHVLLKHDMKVYVDATTVLSSSDVVDIGGVRYYHGTLADFSEIDEASKLCQLHRYLPDTVPEATESVAGIASAAKTVNGHVEKPPSSTKIPQPELKDAEEVLVSAVHSAGSYGVQLSRFNVPKLESELDAFYGEPKNQKAATDVETGRFVIAPFDSQFCRAIVLSVVVETAKVLYTDYGSEADIPVGDLIELSPGRFADQPWGAVTIKTEHELSFDERLTLKMALSSIDEYGLPTYKAEKISSGPVPAGNLALVPQMEPSKPAFPPVQFDAAKQTIFICQMDGNILAGQLGQYTVEELLSRNQKLTSCMKDEALGESSVIFTAGDLVAVREGEGDEAGFYRGLVSKVEGEVVWIYQVDFGVLLRSEMANARRLPAEFISLPQIGIRCELTEAQHPKESEEAFDVKNLRKKTHIDGVDIYEFDLFHAENSPDRTVAQPMKTQNGVVEFEDSGPGPALLEKSEDQVVQPERSTQQSAEAEGVELNIAECTSSERGPSRSAPEPSLAVCGDPLSDKEKPEVTPATIPETVGRPASIPPGSENAHPHVETNTCETANPGTEEIGVRLNSLSMQEPLPQSEGCKSRDEVPEKFSAASESVIYDFASEVGYPEFSSGSERVHVTQKTDSSMVVQLRRFGLDHLQGITNEIKTFLEQHPHIEPTPLSVGDLVIFIRNDCRRRAEIVGTSGDEFLVTCIDYGDAFVAPRSQLVRLPKALEKYVRSAIALEGAFAVRPGQDVDLIFSVGSDGKVRAKTAPSDSPPNLYIEHSYSESVRSCSVISDNADDDELKWVRDPEDPCADKSFDVVVTAAHRATKVCVVRSRALSLAKSIGGTLGNRAESLQPVSPGILQLGSVVVAKLMTEPPRFRRAKVAHCNRSTQLFKLFLVDSGLMVKLPLSSLYQLPTDFSLERQPGYATILRLKADDLTYDARVVSEVFGGTLRCSLSFSHPDDTVPGELCHEATLFNRSGNVVKQLNMKGVASTRTDRFLANPIMLPSTADAEYLDAVVVAAEKTDPSTFRVSLLLVELQERLDKTVVDTDQLKNLYSMKLGVPALAFLQDDPSPWKRARVIGRPFPGKYKLFLVDIGVEITHPVLKTYKCPTNLLHIPEAVAEVSIQSQRQPAQINLRNKLVAVKTHWSIDYSTREPAVELYDHDGSLLLP